MNDYYLRCIESDVPTLLALGQLLGALQITTQEDGTQAVSAPGGAIDIIGHKPHYLTGEPVCDENGVPYWHANLRTPLTLREVAAQMAIDHPEIAAGLANEGRFFLVDENGVAVPPQFPQRVFL